MTLVELQLRLDNVSARLKSSRALLRKEKAICQSIPPHSRGRLLLDKLAKIEGDIIALIAEQNALKAEKDRFVLGRDPIARPETSWYEQPPAHPSSPDEH